MRAVVIIPALNEEQAIASVVNAARPANVQAIVVVDNGSTDRTAAVAAAAGATVVWQPERGYGAACMAGVAAMPEAEAFVFLDGDGSDPPERIGDVLASIEAGTADLVLGSRRGDVEPGSMLWHQQLGNAVMSGLISRLSGVPIVDLPSFKAIRADALYRLALKERRHGWTAELIAKAACLGLRIAEVPTGYRRRTGRSKVSGSLRGATQAALSMNAAIVRVWLASRDANNRISKA
jgi:glycosyltransferase involved in cell wall biosynthesis